MNYDDLLDELYREKKGIELGYNNYPNNKSKRSSKSNSNNINNMNNMNNLNNMNNMDNIKNMNDYQNYENEPIPQNYQGQNEDEIIMNNNNNYTFNKKYYNNNLEMNNNNKSEEQNNNVLRGTPGKLKSKTILKHNNSGNNVKTPQKNYESNNNNNNNYNENQNDNINSYDNYIPEEEFETEEINDENIKGSAGIQNSKNELNNNNNVNESEDIRLNYVMQRLGLESLIEVFENYHMSFNDVLFLSKDDLNELGFKIFQKNRLLSFIEEYTSKAKNYTLEEIQNFFEENNIYNISNNLQ